MQVIDESDHTPWDIVYIGCSRGYSCTWEQFEVLADVEYDNGFGSANIPMDLVIVFKDQEYLTRGEYDGSEWWNHIKPFEIPEARFPITKVVDTAYDSWNGLRSLNAKENGQSN